MVESTSDAAHELLRSLLPPDERELAFGRAFAREGWCALLTEHRLLWGMPSLPSRVGVLEVSSVKSFQGSEEHHRWAVLLRHEVMEQRVHVPAHRFLWWSWGNAEAAMLFTETTFRFSRGDTVLAKALRDALATAGALQEHTARVSTQPRAERLNEVPLRLVRNQRLRHAGLWVDAMYNSLYRGHVSWRWRLLGWALFAVPLMLVNPWLGVLGILLFELLVIGLMRLSWHRNASRRATR